MSYRGSSLDQKRAALDEIAEFSSYDAGPNEEMVKYTFEIFSRHMRGATVLELGPAEGVMTGLLNQLDLELTVVEGAAAFCLALKSRFPNIEVHNALFEEFKPVKTYDNIILGHVLEHVDEPLQLLKCIKPWLAPRTGRMFCAVPNARSLHRQAGVLMNMLSREDCLSKADMEHGHKCVFNPESFRSLFLQAGFSIEIWGGYWLKPVSNAQVDAHWSKELVSAYMVLGERYPDIAGEIYAVCS